MDKICNFGGLAMALLAACCLETRAAETGVDPVCTRTEWVGEIVPLKYGTSGDTPLRAGLFNRPMVVDVNGDGVLDLVVSCWCRPRHMYTHCFINPTPKGTKCLHPVFKASYRVPCGGDTSQQLSDGRTAVFSARSYTLDFPSMKPYVKITGVPEKIRDSDRLRGETWRFADLDGDGRRDLVYATGDWKDYGWDNRWDAAGEWEGGPLHGCFYWLRNEGGDEGSEKWGAPVQLKLANGRPIDVFGHPSPLFEDWDRDGDLDLISVDFTDGITFFENIGTAREPRFAAGRSIVDKFVKPIRADLCMCTATAADWDGDGWMDLFVCEEDGRVAFLRNTGRRNAGTLVFDPPHYLRAERDEVSFGILNTPFAVDIDGDGDQDIVTGNSAGYVAIVENLSGPGIAEPKWEEPRLVEIDGAPLRLMAGDNGSIQGPCERKWGYTCLTVADWDGDGLDDIMLNSTRGEIVWCRNTGKRGDPAFDYPRPVAVEWEGAQPEMKYGWLKPFGSKNLLTQWRTTPCMIDWNGDGLVDLVMVDTEGFLAFYERAVRGGKRILLPPKRVFADEAGNALGFGGWDGKGTGIGGNTGRRKFCIVDWDGDGKLDIVANSGSVCLYRQVKAGDGMWFFRKEGDLVRERMAGHSTCPTVCDFDADGVPDLLIGAEDGYFYHLRNPRSVRLVKNIGRGRQMFLDDTLVAAMTAKRVWHKPVKSPHNPVLKPETELEKGGPKHRNPMACPFVGGVWYDGKDALYKCFYNAGWADGLAYAWSKDGIEWTRPRLNGDGGNLVFRCKGVRDQASVVFEPDAADGYRFKNYLTVIDDGAKGEVRLSKDGMNWTEAVRTGSIGDATCIFRDPFTRRYCYSIRAGSPTEGRTRALATSTDFIEGAKGFPGRARWLKDAVDGGREKSGYELYNMDCVAYESVMIGLLQVMKQPQNDYWSKLGEPKSTFLRFGFSRPGDIRSWNFPKFDGTPDNAFIDQTRHCGDWDMGYVRSNSGVCIVLDDTIRFYYTGFAGDKAKADDGRQNVHTSGMYANGAMGFAELRRDGFCSIEAGELRTKPLAFAAGDRLWLNVDARDGRLTVAATAADGSTLGTKTIEGTDATRLEAFPLACGQPFTLRFTMQGRAKLYSFWLSDAGGRSGGYLGGGSPASRDLTDGPTPTNER